MIENKETFNWRLFWNTRKEFVLAILLFSLSALVLLVGVFQQISPVQETLSELSKKQAELDKFQNKANNLEALVTGPEKNSFPEVDSVLPSYKPLLELLSNLNSTANSTQVVIKNFSLNPGAIASDSTQVKKSNSGQAYDYLDLDFSVIGPLWRIQSFMSLIEQSSPISTITRMALNRDISENPDSEAQANLVLRTFYFTQAIKTTISSPLPEISAKDEQILAEIRQLIPNNLEKQNEVIKGDRGDLFGIQGMTIEELEKELRRIQEENETAAAEQVEMDGQTVIEEQVEIENPTATEEQVESN